jgi:hypothetical protein
VHLTEPLAHQATTGQKVSRIGGSVKSAMAGLLCRV